MKKLRLIITVFAFFILVSCELVLNSTTQTTSTTTTTTVNSTTTTQTEETTSNTTTTIEQSTTTTTEQMTTTTTTEQSTTTTTESSTSSPYDTTYYREAIGLTGDTLKSKLHDIIDNHTIISYSKVDDYLKFTDEDPNNPNNIILFYTGRSQDKDTFIGGGSNQNDWNKEHVWPKSIGDIGTYGPGSDMHHLRPTDVSVNSKRGNLEFDNGGASYYECTIRACNYDNDSWEPDDSIKGDVARMIFYMAVRYEGDDGFTDLEINESTSNGSQDGPVAYIGKLSTLLEWNALDPVDVFEMNRNNIIYDDYQHNRNPFIDHPEWANEIWGN